MAGDRMAKRSIGSLMRKKLSDITNSQLQDQSICPTQEENPLQTCSTDKDCIQQLLKERVTLMQLLAEKTLLDNLDPTHWGVTDGCTLVTLSVYLHGEGTELSFLSLAAEICSNMMAEVGGFDGDRVARLLRSGVNPTRPGVLVDAGLPTAMFNKMIEWSKAEMQMMRANFQKLHLQNLSLAQSNSHMLAELNLGRERIKALQHEISWRAALLKGNNAEEVVGKVEMDYKNNGSMSQPQEGDEKAGQPSPNASNRKQSNKNRRRCTRGRSTSSSTTASTKNARKEKVQDKRHCARLEKNGLKPLEDLFEIEDAKYPIIQSRPYQLSSRAVKDEKGNNSASRNEALRSSFGKPLRKSDEKGQSSKDTNFSKSLSSKD